MRHSLLSSLLALLATLGMLAPAQAETLSGSNVDTRTVVALRVSAAEAQRLLPAPWQVNPMASGPSKDANLTMSFIDRLIEQDAEGKSAAVPTYRAVAVGIPAKHPQTGESAPMVIRVFNSNPDAVPGYYKIAVPATVTREQTLKGVGVEPGTLTERWEARDRSGGSIDFRIQYQRTGPSRAKIEARPHSALEPALFRIYRVDQGSDVVKSIPAGIDRVQKQQLRVAVPEFAKLFDGSEQVVSVTVIPWYVRQVFLP